MKESLKQIMERLLERMDGRIRQLKNNMDSYAMAGNYIDAGKTQIKLEQFMLIREDIKEQLED